MRITFLHPDLGLGGAERLIIDAATALVARGHAVTIVTAARDARRCFADVHPDRPPAAGLPTVRVLPPPLPRTLLGGAAAALAAARMTALAAAVAVARERPDVVVVDQVAAPVLLLRAAGVAAVFYCHFPDVDVEASLRAAAVDSGGGGSGGGGGDGEGLGGLRRRAHALYRSVINGIEAAGVRAADAVGVNSDFTRAAYGRAYPGAPPAVVVYPAVRPVEAAATQLGRGPPGTPGGERGGTDDAVEPAGGAGGPPPLTLLSINRYERKKNIPLALATLAALLADDTPRPLLPPALRARLRLVHMGGYDGRLAENVAHHAELAARAAAPDLAGRVALVRNAPDAAVGAALAAAAALLYTPADEHFGIVPLQAAAAGLPVVAVAAGGPLETVVHGVTGWLVAPTADAFAAAAATAVTAAAAAADAAAAGAAATTTATTPTTTDTSAAEGEGGEPGRHRDGGAGGGGGGGGGGAAARAAMAAAARERVAGRFSMAALGRGFEGLAVEAVEAARRRRAGGWGGWLRSWWGG